MKHSIAPTIHLFNRRALLKAGAGALVVGFSAQATLAYAGNSAAAATLRPAKAVAKDRVDSFVSIEPNGKVTIYVGKVDLGTGTKTALAQMAADELDVAFEQIDMVMGDTATTPDQWITGANLTIAQGGGELRKACATARAALLTRASSKLGAPVSELQVSKGVVSLKSDATKAVSYNELLQGGGKALDLKVDAKATAKPASEYRVVGKSIPRVDIPEKVSGEFMYVHDFRLPACCTRAWCALTSWGPGWRQSMTARRARWAALYRRCAGATLSPWSPKTSGAPSRLRAH